jgi:ribosome-binding protein aMBF1 (putative translation factor)
MTGVSAAAVITDVRRRAGLSQAELGRRAGIPGSVIGRWERAEVEPAFGTVTELVRALGYELVLERRDDGHDLALIRRSLAASPAARLAELVEAVRAFDAMSSTVARHRG